MLISSEKCQTKAEAINFLESSCATLESQSFAKLRSHLDPIFCYYISKQDTEVVCGLFSISTLILILSLCLLLWSICIRIGLLSISTLISTLTLCSLEASIGIGSRSRSILRIAHRLPHGCEFDQIYDGYSKSIGSFEMLRKTDSYLQNVISFPSLSASPPL